MSSLGADEAVVPESEVKQLKVRVRELERLLGKKTLEVMRGQILDVVSDPISRSRPSRPRVSARLSTRLAVKLPQ